MRNHKGDYKGFIQNSRTWYEKLSKETNEYTDRVSFGFYAHEGGTSGEMAMCWYLIGGENTARLEVYEDAFHTLAQFKDVIDALGELDSKLIQPKEFCDLLIKLGFTDKTEEVRKVD